MGYFEQAWAIEVLRFNLFLQYWYVWAIILVILGIYFYFSIKNDF